MWNKNIYIFVFSEFSLILNKKFIFLNLSQQEESELKKFIIKQKNQNQNSYIIQKNLPEREREREFEANDFRW